MKLLFTLLSTLLIGSSFTQTWIRYNQAGYFTKENKRLVVMSNDNISQQDWEITTENNIILKDKISSKHIPKTGYCNTSYNYEVDFSSVSIPGKYIFTTGESTIKFTISDNPLAGKIDEALLYLQTKRSGNNSPRFHNPSHLGDSESQIFSRQDEDNTKWSATDYHINTTGGWYDAGDYIKFTLTTAYTTYLLLRSYEVNPDLFISNDTIPRILSEALVGLRYLMKTHPTEEIFIIQTGGYLDHTFGDRLPEDDELDGKRESYSALSKPQMGLTAAALALGAKTLQPFIPKAEVDLYLEQATAIYQSANKSNESNAWWQGNGKEIDYDNPPYNAQNTGGTGWETFYQDETSNDNMALAALELYNLTNDDHYLSYSRNQHVETGWWASWGTLNMLVHNRSYELTGTPSPHLTEDLSNFSSKLPYRTNIFKRSHDLTWGTMASLLIVANNALLYNKTSQKTTYSKTALNTLNYTFGLNNWGTSFFASHNIKHSFKESYSPIFKLQPRLYNYGEFSPGPGDLKTFEELDFNYGKRWENEFNTLEAVYFDDKDNYMTAETTITLMADGIFMLTLAQTLFAD